MTELSNGGPELQIHPDREQTVNDKWFAGFLRGNDKWPQHTEGIGVFTTAAILQDPPDNWDALSTSRLSRKQISIIGGSASTRHRNVGIHLATQEHAEEADIIMDDEKLQAGWSTAVNEAVIPTILNYIDFIQPSQDAESQEGDDIARIQSFFENPDNAQHITNLTRVFSLANKTLLNPDSVALADFYQRTLYDNKEYEDQLPQVSARYKTTFPDSQLSFEDNPGQGAWELAVNNVQKTIESELPGQNMSWLNLD